MARLISIACPYPPAYHCPPPAHHTLMTDLPAEAKHGSFAVVGLLTRYDIDEHLSASVNLNNVFDRQV